MWMHNEIIKIVNIEININKRKKIVIANKAFLPYTQNRIKRTKNKVKAKIISEWEHNIIEKRTKK